MSDNLSPPNVQDQQSQLRVSPTMQHHRKHKSDNYRNQSPLIRSGMQLTQGIGPRGDSRKTQSRFVIPQPSPMQQQGSMPVPAYDSKKGRFAPNPTPTSNQWSTINDFKFINIAGKGSFGVVRKVRCNFDKQIYAIKTIPLNAAKVALLNENNEISLNEVEIMKELNHPNIVHMYGSFVDYDFGTKHATDEQQEQKPRQQQMQQADSQEYDDKIEPGKIRYLEEEEDDARKCLLDAGAYLNQKKDLTLQGKCLHIVLEFADNGDLQALVSRQIKRKMYFSERDLWNFAWQLCMGVLHLHSRGVIHRDIKCMNLMLTGKDDDATIKLGDMSESRVLDQQSYIKTTKIIGTPLSLSPEVVKNEGYDQRSDVWGMGVALYTMACLKPPFYDDNVRGLFNAIIFKTQKPVIQYSQELNGFIARMLNKKKEDRPLIVDLIDFFYEKQIRVRSLNPTECESPVARKNRSKQIYGSLEDLISQMGDEDRDNYHGYKESQVKAFNKKRLIEKNKLGINNDFDALKNRVKAGQNSFRKQHFKMQRRMNAGQNNESRPQLASVTELPKPDENDKSRSRSVSPAKGQQQKHTNFEEKKEGTFQTARESFGFERNTSMDGLEGTPDGLSPLPRPAPQKQNSFSSRNMSHQDDGGSNYKSEQPSGRFNSGRYSVSGGVQQIGGYLTKEKGIARAGDPGFRMPKASDLARISEHNIGRSDDVTDAYYQAQKRPPKMATKRHSRVDVVKISKGNQDWGEVINSAEKQNSLKRPYGMDPLQVGQNQFNGLTQLADGIIIEAAASETKRRRRVEAKPIQTGPRPPLSSSQMHRGSAEKPPIQLKDIQTRKENEKKSEMRQIYLVSEQQQSANYNRPASKAKGVQIIQNTQNRHPARANSIIYDANSVTKLNKNEFTPYPSGQVQKQQLIQSMGMISSNKVNQTPRTNRVTIDQLNSRLQRREEDLKPKLQNSVLTQDNNQVMTPPDFVMPQRKHSHALNSYHSQRISKSKANEIPTLKQEAIQENQAQSGSSYFNSSNKRRTQV